MESGTGTQVAFSLECIRSPRYDQHECRPLLAALAYVLSDLLVLTLAWTLAVVLRSAFHADFTPVWYLRLWPVLAICIATYATRGLYPDTGMSPVKEFQELTISTSMVFSSLIVFTFLVHTAEAYSRLVFLWAWVLTIVCLPFSRAIVRRLLGRKRWWGSAVVLLGAGPAASAILRTIHNDPVHGIRVQGVFGNTAATHLEGVPVLGNLDQVQRITNDLGVTIAIVAIPDFGAMPISEIVNRYSKSFSQLIMIPDTGCLTNLCVETHGLGHLMTIRFQQNLLLRGPRIWKRIVDVILSSVGGLAILPLMITVAIAIKLTSRGPLFYGHSRIGKGQRLFKAWKFRTMAIDADAVLRQHLALDPALQHEWMTTHKLRNDPRVTRVGKFLRTWSIDELPQLWNVLRGEMSLIGPRPIVRDEVAKYADKFEIYTRVLPGVTGLWQVSGRSDTDYQRRVDLDAYYVQNWSPWLDMYVLGRTLKVVVARTGAY